VYKTRERERKCVVNENRLDQDVFSCIVQDPKHKTVFQAMNVTQIPKLFYFTGPHYHYWARISAQSKVNARHKPTGFLRHKQFPQFCCNNTVTW